MGVHDEHWCSNCRRKIDKVKELYHETRLVNPDRGKLQSEKRFGRGFLCSDCYNSDEFAAFREAEDRLRKRGNPTFSLTVHCASTAICADHQRSDDPNVNCAFIYALGDRLYCGRRHPGQVEVGQDESAVDADTTKRIRTWLGDTLGSILGTDDPFEIVSQTLGLLKERSLDDLRPRTPVDLILEAPEPGTDKDTG